MRRAQSLEERVKETIEAHEKTRRAYRDWVEEDDYRAYSFDLLPTVVQNTMQRTHGTTILDVHAALTTLRDEEWTPETPAR